MLKTSILGEHEGEVWCKRDWRKHANSTDEEGSISTKKKTLPTGPILEGGGFCYFGHESVYIREACELDKKLVSVKVKD